MMKSVLATFAMVMGFSAPALAIPVLIEGSFGSAEGCELAVQGTISTADAALQARLPSDGKILVCAVQAKSAKFTHRATKKALSDGGVYWISGGLTGEYFDQLKVEEVAGLGE